MQLNHLSLSALRRLFAGLEAPNEADLIGVFRGDFVGPAWLRACWPPLLQITGLGGWHGKQFDGQSGAVNLVLRRAGIEARFPMLLIRGVSNIDGKPGLLLHYRRENPFPWPYIIDELRRLDENTCLGMTAVDLGPLRQMAFPFMLQRLEATDGL